MIKIEKERLNLSSLKIEKQETLLEIYAEYYGVSMVAVIGTKEGNRIYQLTAMDPPKYATRLVITKEMLEQEKGLTFSVLISCNGETISTNKIPLILDTKKIKLDIRQVYNNEIIQINDRLTQLEQKLKAYTSGFIKPNLPEFKLDCVKTGMVLTAIDDNGNLAMRYPFNDVITEINGKKSVSRKIKLTSSDIPMEDQADSQSLFQVVTSLQNSVNQLNTFINGVTDILTTLNSDLTQLRLDFEEFKNSSII